MHIEFLLEERSAKVALKAILPKILSDDVSSDFHVFEGKHDLLKQLPARLKGYNRGISEDWRIIVLIDEDREDCMALKARLEKAAHDAGFVTKSSAPLKGNFQVVNRLAIEELEAWFFGDIEALQTAYPKVSKRSLHRMNQHPDAITGGTHEALGRLLKQSSYHRGGLPKTVVAQNIAQHMEPNRNRSRSFQVFVEGLEACVGPGGLRN
jgi:hypothetical protein